MTDKTSPNDANFSGTVIKALDILDCLAEYRRPMSAQEIAKACDVSRPTAYRLLTTLMSRGFVRADERHQYTLGTKLLTFGRLVLDSIDLPELARPYLVELCALSNETANLSILDDDQLLYVGKEENPRTLQSAISVRLRSNVGTRILPHSSAMGKAILAHLPADEFDALLERATPLKACTPYTITDIDALQLDLDLTRRRGYAIDDREVDEGTRCVAAPVFDSGGRVVAAVSIAGPAYRISVEQLHALAPEVVRVTQAFSRQLGYIETSHRFAALNRPSP